MNLTEKLDWLYKTTGLSYVDVELKTYENGNRVSPGYQSRLRRGEKTNPGYRVLSALAEAFGIPVTFFFDEVNKEYLAEVEAMLSDETSQTVSEIALRALPATKEERLEAIKRLEEMVTQEE